MKIMRSLLLLVCAAALGACGIGRASAPAARPNIVLILTDDMTTGDLAFMPKTKMLIQDQGASFSQFLISMPLCCPSRTSILRGQYSHNTKILGNEPPAGGFERFYQLGLEASTVAVWLQEAGYRTALIGKYLNGYPAEASRTYVPPGWTEWYSSPGDINYNDAAYTEFNYTLNENGTLVKYGHAPEDYGTDVYAAKATDFIQRSVDAGQPFFAYIATYAPHNPSTPAPRYADAFPDLQLPNSPSFNEADISDKSRFFADNPLLTDADIESLQEKYRLRIQSLQAVDDLVETVVGKLQETGQLEDTYIFFASDNGFHLGDHRLLAGKDTAFEEDIRVPLLVRGPAVQPGKTINELAGNIDLGPTFAELAGVQPPDFVDGRSLVPLLQGRFIWSWRNVYLLERGVSSENGFFTDRPVTLGGPLQIGEREPADSIYDYKAGGNFRGLRTNDYTYVEFQNGDVELYDLRADPYELENIARTAGPALLDKFHKWLSELEDCAANSCRELDVNP
jgi:N-acetylglucosamine-6-sulfatase